MTRFHSTAAVFTLLAAGLTLGAGCGTGSSCASETPQIDNVPSCSDVMPDTDVTVHLDLCPTCNQTDPSCGVDLSQVAATSTIQLDPIVHACESSNNCPPSCSVQGVSCTFRSPPAGSYTILVVDPLAGSLTQPFEVTTGGNVVSCQ